MFDLRLLVGNRRGKFLLSLFVAILSVCSVDLHAQCSSPANAIVAENCLPGTSSSVWDINGQAAGDLTIQGFATDMSVNVGGTINFKIDTTASAYTIDIYRMGYYQGNGARLITSITPSAHLPQTQPPCFNDSVTGITDCGTWAVSASWTVPTTATSGIYFAHLTRPDTGGDSLIVFVVRNDASRSAVLYQTSDPTWQAYNYYGNGSLYGPYGTFGLPYRTFGVSYNRPVLTRGFNSEAASFAFGAEFAMVQWLEANGYDVSYFSGVDTARYGSLIKNHKVFMDCGHDEYVSGDARASITAARDAGVNLAFFSGNEIFWKTRFANSVEGNNTPFRTVMCYKETLAFTKLDPADPPTWTGTWRDPTFSPPGDGGLPENALTGTLFMVNGPDTDNSGDLTMKVPQADGQMRFWRNTAVASLPAGGSYTLVKGSLGYEWDEDVDNGFRPAGAFRLSTTTYPLTTDYLLDYGATYGAGTATHHMMMYRAASGALVFGAGTIDWAYGLNSNHDNPFDFDNPSPDINMEQATVNLFADMGVQPATIQPGLTLATASTDSAAPHSVITSPTNGVALSTGSAVTITGTASDSGGVVAGVEFSGDGGRTWHPANGRGSWSYSWTPNATGTTTLMSRAVDDTGNLETPTGGVTASVAPQTCPCTIFEQTTPLYPDGKDSSAIEVGLKFRADADGSIIGVRFYKAATNTGTHIGHVWTDTGTLLGTVTFSGESASGWQQANFSSPIAATANTVYVVSYFAPNGHYSADMFALEQAGVDNPPLHALANGVDGGNGLYVYNANGGFPTLTLNAANYWVDVIYSSSNTYSVTGNVSGIGGAGATVTMTGPENLNTATDSSGNFAFDGVVNGTYTVSVSNPGVTFTPASRSVSVSFAGASGVNFAATVSNPLSISGNITNGAAATVTLAGAGDATTVADASGNYTFTGLLSGSYTVTPALAGYIFMPSTQAVTLTGSSAANVNFQGQVCTCISIWPASATPAVVDSGDSTPAELGVVFKADSPAYLTGVRFYKASTNLGTHVGHLWSSTGQLLGTATFPSETASGWQQGYFSTPVLINADTPYVVSYFAPQGHYSASSNYFSTAGTDAPPLHALANGVAGPNGVYIYTTSGAFPNGSYQATNYWVDVLYAAQAYSVSGTITGPGAAGATLTLSGNTTATTTADGSGNFTFNSVYAGNYSLTPSATNSVFLPGTQNISVATGNVTGVSFQIPQACPCYTVWQPSTVPATVDSGDARAIETGVKVQSNSDGYILGIRFYKGANNTGTHVANLWTVGAGSASGTLLSTATFANESATGWQQVMFANPVPVAANTPYVASYFAPAGHYSVDAAYFASTGKSSPPLLALQDGADGGNGIFTYGTASTYPNTPYNSDNYWVDVIYASTGAYSIGGTITGAGSAGTAVVLGGAATRTTTTDASGNFSFTGLASGSYTVTPSASGVVFSPASQTVTLSTAHALGINFSGTAQGYPVSGTVTGGAGITVTLAGTTTQTTTADASGNFSFASVPNGTYTVTPAGAGFSVTPANKSITVSNAAVSGVNFTSTVILNSISGTVSGGAGATVTLAGATTTTTTADASGNYAFANISAGTYVVTPSIHEGVVFAPGSQTVTLGGANATGINFTVPQNCPCDMIWPTAPTPGTADWGDKKAVEVGVNFTATADAYITGLRFYKAATNTGTHVGHLWSSTGTLLGTATFTSESTSGWQQVFFPTPIPIAANTIYVASYLAPVGHYSADAGYFKTNGVNTPPLQVAANTTTAPNGVYLYATSGGFPNGSGNGTNYWVDVIYTPTSTYSVSGTISGAGGPGATITLSGAGNATAVADASGNFSVSGLVNGAYVITPGGTNYAYSPSTLNATVNNAHVFGITFSSTTASYSITGTISGAGGNGATVTLSGASSGTTTAAANGTFSFPGLANGAYTVAVNHAGYVITPVSQAVTVNGADASTTFSSAAQTFSITGTISGAGGNGAAVTLSGASSGTTTAAANGTFSFPGLANGSYTVAVSHTGYVMTPASQAVTLNGANASPTFSSTAQTFSITGTISGTGGNGATVRLTGAASATTTASTTGAYTFTGLAAGSYTVAASKTGFVFTPASQTVTVSTANVTANFSSAQTFTISGTISGTGGNGATVSLTGAATATTTASTSGAYSFTGVVAGSYTVTPSKAGFAFTPANRAVTVSTANVTASFTSAQTFTISGTISGTGGNGATVSLTGAATATTTASTSGAYSFTGVVAGSYTVTPTKTGFVFTPTNRAVTVSTANVTASFTSVQTYTISGTISGTGGSGATVKLSGAATATTTANASGAYSFTGIQAGTYTVTPSKTGAVFTPTSRSVTVNNANVTANFSGVQTFTISGTVSGAGASGATVRLTGAATASTTTNASGAYSFTGVAPGSYTVTPTKTGFNFSPANKAVTVSTANVTASFSSTAQTFSISGTISGAGGASATVRLSGAGSATTTANSSGAFTFTGVTAGTYTVTPSRTGHTYTPTNRSVTVSSSNVTGVAFSSN